MGGHPGQGGQPGPGGQQPGSFPGSGSSDVDAGTSFFSFFTSFIQRILAFFRSLFGLN